MTFTITKAKREHFRQLVALEPRLDALRQEARRIARENRGNAEFCANRHWYGFRNPDGSWNHGLKGQLVRLVGSLAGRPEPMERRVVGLNVTGDFFSLPPLPPPLPGFPEELTTSEAYDTAYEVIYETLPDCRHEPRLLGC